MNKLKENRIQCLEGRIARLERSNRIWSSVAIATGLVAAVSLPVAVASLAPTVLSGAGVRIADLSDDTAALPAQEQNGETESGFDQSD